MPISNEKFPEQCDNNINSNNNAPYHSSIWNFSMLLNVIDGGSYLKLVQLYGFRICKQRDKISEHGPRYPPTMQ